MEVLVTELDEVKDKLSASVKAALGKHMKKMARKKRGLVHVAISNSSTLWYDG